MRFVAPFALLGALSLSALAGGCANLVGDACSDQTDCGTAMYCEKSMPEGYCTVRNCEADGCPDHGVCVSFDEDLSFCMARCSSDGDCRGDYVCVQDFGPHAFCNTAQ